jgi:prephenate dehydrogenase
MRDVCVVGLGLIGGSFLRAVSKPERSVWGATTSEMDAKTAASNGFDVDTDVDGALRKAAERDAIIVLAVPLPAVEAVLRQVARVAPQCLLTDVTSVKAPILDAVRAISPQLRYVGGHPMAGTADSGWAAGKAELFTGAAWVLGVERDTDLGDWKEIARLVLEIGAHVVPLPAASHDETVARISHLPHLLAAILASIGAEGGPLAMSLAAGSYTDGTRVAGTRPELVAAMTEGNKAALLPILDEALGRLGAARGSLASTGGLIATIKDGHKGAEMLLAARENNRASVRIELTEANAWERLQDLGERGGRITAVDATSAHGEI